MQAYKSADCAFGTLTYDCHIFINVAPKIPVKLWRGGSNREAVISILGSTVHPTFPSIFAVEPILFSPIGASTVPLDSWNRINVSSAAITTLTPAFKIVFDMHSKNHWVRHIDLFRCHKRMKQTVSIAFCLNQYKWLPFVTYCSSCLISWNC